GPVALCDRMGALVRLRPFRKLLRLGDQADEALLLFPRLQREQPLDRLGVLRARVETVDAFCGKQRDPAGAEDHGRAPGDVAPAPCGVEYETFHPITGARREPSAASGPPASAPAPGPRGPASGPRAPRRSWRPPIRWPSWRPARRRASAPWNRARPLPGAATRPEAPRSPEGSCAPPPLPRDGSPCRPPR